MLKDHNCEKAIDLVIKSHQDAVREAAKSQGFDITNVAVIEGDNFSTKPVQILLSANLDTEVKKEVLRGLEKIQFVDLEYKLIEEASGKSYYIYIHIYSLFTF